MYTRSRVATQVFGMTFGFVAIGVLMALILPGLPQKVILGAILLYGVVMLLLNLKIKAPKVYRNELLKLDDEKWIERIAVYVFMALLGMTFLMIFTPLQFNSNVVFLFGMCLGFSISLLGATSFIIGRISLGRKNFPQPAFTGKAARIVSVLIGLSGSAILALCLSFLMET